MGSTLERGPERDFRWRGRDVTRLEAVADGVFALALTLVMLSDGMPHRFSELRAVFVQVVPLLISFVIIAMIWHAHYLFFRRYGLRDGVCALLNAALMFLVLLFAYPLKLLFGLICSVVFGFGSPIPVEQIDDVPFPILTVYSLGLASIYTVIALLYRHAYRQSDALELDRLERFVTRQYEVGSWIMVGFGLVSAMLTLVLPPPGQAIAGWMYFGIGPVLGVYSARCGRERHALREARDAVSN
ncbi:MAG: TMEM175 family protein [Planctomycetota bacterium]